MDNISLTLLLDFLDYSIHSILFHCTHKIKYLSALALQQMIVLSSFIGAAGGFIDALGFLSITGHLKTVLPVSVGSLSLTGHWHKDDRVCSAGHTSVSWDLSQALALFRSAMTLSPPPAPSFLPKLHILQGPLLIPGP